MITKTIELYSAKELQEKFPHAFERAQEKYVQNELSFGVPWQEETFSSLKIMIGKSTGFIPCHLEIYNRISISGPAVYLSENDTIKVIA